MARWAGPVLLFAGVAAIALLYFEPPSSRGLVVAWLLTSALSPERILPLAGLGIASAFLSYRTALLAGFYLLVAYVAATALVDLARSFAAIPTLQPLAAPISLVLTGLTLIARGWIRAWLILPVAAFIGSLLAVTTLASDPTFHDPIVPRLGIAVGLWIVASSSLTLKTALMRRWLPATAAPIAVAILGSWFTAIGLLYGGAALVSRPMPLARIAPSRPSPTPPLGPNRGFDTGFDDLGSELDRLPATPKPGQKALPQ